MFLLYFDCFVCVKFYYTGLINGEEIITTETHPFYVKNQGFIKAGELAIGDELLNSNCNVLLIENHSVELTDEPTKVYNFQVEDFHTYYAGGLGVLVHNASNEYKTKTVRTAKGEEKIPIVDKPGSTSWKQAVKELRSARKKETIILLQIDSKRNNL